MLPTPTEAKGLGQQGARRGLQTVALEEQKEKKEGGRLKVFLY